MRVTLVAVLVVAVVGVAWGFARGGQAGAAPVAAASPAASGPLKLWSQEAKGFVMLPPVVKTEAEWRKILKPLEFQVARQAGTERAFTGATADEHRHGIYKCVACGTDLFLSDAKFESGTGWPSFTKPIASENVTLRSDKEMFMERVEVLCRRCGSHLGHVFDDGPQPTGKRYCMNSAAMRFVPQAGAK